MTVFDGEPKKPFVGTKIDMFEYIVLSDVYAHNDKCEEGGEYYSRLSEVLTSRYVDVDTLFSLGIDIGSQICTDFRSTRTRLTAYLNTMNALLRVHFDVNGEDSPTQKSYMGLRYYMTLAMVNELPRTEATEKMFSIIKRTLEIDTEDEQLNENNRMHVSNLEVLEGEFDAYKKMRDIANKYKEQELDDDTLQTLRQKATLLTQEAMRHRKYGTKPAYIDASIGGAWIFYDADDWRKKISNGKDDNKELHSNVAAIVCYSPYDEFKTLNFRSTYDRFGDRIVEAGDTLDKIDLTLYIDHSGGISMDADGVTDFGLELKISPSQELALRAEIASNFYDLSMPVIKSRPEEKTFENVIDKKRVNLNPIQDLLIPRIKYFEQPEDFPASNDIIRTIRKHDVTWFVRVLPNGWHASPDALVEAEAHGIELAENETFVKAHSRGHGNRIVGHHAIRRAIKEQRN